MRFKNIILVIILACLLAISTASATDIDSNDTQIVSASDNDGSINMETDLNILSENEGTYSDLMNEIGTGGNITLTKSVYRYVESDPDKYISISTSGVLDGNGAVIDMAGKRYGFTIGASSFVVKNLTIKNVNSSTSIGVIYFTTSSRNGIVSNCNFTNNIGGNVNVNNGSVINCNFINNTALYGGAARFSINGAVENCNFINNTGSYGGAVYFYSSANGIAAVKNCNFINNSARIGGAIYFCDSMGAGTDDIMNCYFTGNNATKAAAIYFYGSSSTKNICNSIILNNRADAHSLKINNNENNFEIIFYGNNNLLNAIYSNGDVNIINVTYWGANGITNTGSSSTSPIRTQKAPGQNITVIMMVNNVLVLNETKVTNDEGKIVLDAVAGNWTLTACHDADSYYTKSETTIKLKIDEGLDEDSELSKYTYSDLRNKIGTGGNIKLTNGIYRYRMGDGDTIEISKSGVIDGNGAVIDMAGSSVRAFTVTAHSVTIKNLTIKNAHLDKKDGAAIYFLNPYEYITDYRDGSIIDIIKGEGIVENCNFINNSAKSSGAIYFNQGNGEVRNCNFINNKANYAGAVEFSGYCFECTITGCNFINNTATDSHGGAICSPGGLATNTVTSCNFTNNTAAGYGGAFDFTNLKNPCSIKNCNFIDNTAGFSGGAIAAVGSDMRNCNFVNNTAVECGGAIYVSGNNIINCNFEGNNATSGSAIYFRNTATRKISNSCFLNNKANVDDNSPLNIIQNGNNIEITFMGQDNLLNAIYSVGDVSFTNVTYWGENGITNTGRSTIMPTRSLNESGQNITILMVVNDIIVLNTTKVTNDEGKIVLDAIAGNCTIMARHDADSYYTKTETTSTFNSTGNETILELSVSGHTVTATINPKVTGNIMLTVKNESGIVKTIESIVNNSVVEFDLTGLFAGEYNITATYAGSLNYYPSKNNIVWVLKHNATADIVMPTNVSVGENSTVNVKLPDGVGGTVTVKVDGREVAKVNVTGGTANVHLADLVAGEHVVEFAYSGDGNYAPLSEIKELYVNKKASSVSAKPVEFTEGETVTVDVAVTEGATGVVFVDINTNKFYGLINKDKASVRILGLVAGNYSADISYMGDDNFYSSYANVNVNVNAKPASKVESSIAITEINDNKITAFLKDSEGKGIADANVKYIINGNTKSLVTAADGSFVVEAQYDIPIGIVYDGDNKTKSSKSTITIKKTSSPSVVKVESRFNITGGSITIKGYAVDTKADEQGISYATELLDAKGNPIKGAKIQFAVNNKIYNRTTYENGSFDPYHLNMLRAGRYTMAFSFGGNDNYTSTFAVVCVDLDKKPITIKASAKTYKASTKTKKYTVTLSTIVGSSADKKAHLRTGLKVNLTVNGKTYVGKTNSEGKVTFKISNLNKKGKYIAKISYEGDMTYERANKSVKLTIK